MAEIKTLKKSSEKSSSPKIKMKSKPEGTKRPRMKLKKKTVKRTGYSQDFYQKLRDEIEFWLNKKIGKNHKWAEYIMIAPDLFHLLIKLVADPKVPFEEKGKLALVIAYFISPIDFIPEGLLGPGAYVDDVALSCYVLNSVINNTSAAIVRKHWVGDKDIFKVISEILKNADDMIGSGLWGKIKQIVTEK